MMQANSNRLTLILLALALVVTSVSPCEAQDKSTKTLKGGVQQSGTIQKTSVYRPGNGEDDDPFSDEPKAAPVPAAVPAKTAAKVTVPVKKPIQARAQDIWKQLEQLLPDEPSTGLKPVNTNAPQSKDFDSSPQMQVLWDAWHKRVAAAIFERFNMFAKGGFSQSPPYLAQISYAVTKDGHIQNIQFIQPTENPLFNQMITQAVQSLDGEMEVLSFPPGSRRTSVAKKATFQHNFGREGYRYTINDKEQIPSAKTKHK
jgi:outer membrane biosynthesis protein TonB